MLGQLITVSLCISFCFKQSNLQEKNDMFLSKGSGPISLINGSKINGFWHARWRTWLPLLGGTRPSCRSLSRFISCSSWHSSFASIPADKCCGKFHRMCGCVSLSAFSDSAYRMILQGGEVDYEETIMEPKVTECRSSIRWMDIPKMAMRLGLMVWMEKLYLFRNFEGKSGSFSEQVFHNAKIMSDPMRMTRL
jgi:hypothetical protein